ncbi:MAG: hypothetical protein AB3K77_11100 [Methanosarcinaceae archaeon]|uniref:hypothetical protein n=1 Tax=Methanosarcina sp. MTP4 TaxID=1434100 RepID=UPI0012E0071A|nr:hypothetical protein [Methanosarcina sp. MTP4]
MSLEWRGILFDYPYPIKKWEPLSNAGIYAIELIPKLGLTSLSLPGLQLQSMIFI